MIVRRRRLDHENNEYMYMTVLGPSFRVGANWSEESMCRVAIQKKKFPQRLASN